MIAYLKCMKERDMNYDSILEPERDRILNKGQNCLSIFFLLLLKCIFK